MKALVTGAKGMLGQDLCPILEDNGFEVIETDIHNLDITKDCTEFIMAEKPDLVIHCAAYTNVDKAEEDLETARLINAVGAENIAKACAKADATMVYISTDYVFDGTKNEPYLPEDKPNPINNYGLTKLQGEEAVKKHCTKYYIARTSWLYGHHGRNFVETMISLADKPELKVVDDQIGCPTWTVELANGILKLLDKPFGTYHVCGSGHTSWYGFAKEIFEQEGLKVNLNPCATEEFPRPAKRPKFSIMENNGITRDWKSALKDYLALREVTV
ncbi:MAG: dTDP-4-dehydrorhamnose reductase [Candidatus Gastranaerophilales bacterium]|nr:dTDP-4-dehydrorhamnose reductase [Candidatus Gastranaerophilales bacterium]MCM1073331.1 dTDP-4-dehydrorhamnose reductase [Bacteroides sp.]